MTNTIFDFEIPEKFIELGEFYRLLLENVFPEVEKGSAAGYAEATHATAVKLGLVDEDGYAYDTYSERYIINEDSDLFRILYTINEYNNRIVSAIEKDPDITIMNTNFHIDAHKNYKEYIKGANHTPPSHYHGYHVFVHQMATFVPKGVKTKKDVIYDGWFGNTLHAPHKETAFDAAAMFTYFLVKQKSSDEIYAFLTKLLEVCGITVKSKHIEYLLHSFDFTTEDKEIYYCEDEPTTKFRRLSNKAIQILALSLFTVLRLFAHHSNSQVVTKQDKKDKLTATYFTVLHETVSELFKGFETACLTIDAAQKKLKTQLSVLDTRAFKEGADMSLPGVFVFPKFTRDDNRTDNEGDTSPCENFSNNGNVKSLIISPTGMGKSNYLKMLALSTLLSEEEKQQEPYSHIIPKINLPKDMLAISIPSRMFTHVFSVMQYDESYAEHINDFVSLFFFSLCNLPSNENFYVTYSDNTDNNRTVDSNYVINNELYEIVSTYAKSGRLILMLDAFDEIPAGQAREDYKNALHNFNQSYCRPDIKGAHIVITTREMSAQTLDSLKNSMGFVGRTPSTYRISSLDREQRAKLIRNLAIYNNKSSEETEEAINTIEGNPFMRELAKSPFMLSVFYWSLGKTVFESINNFISSLTKKNAAIKKAQYIRYFDSINNHEFFERIAYDSVKNKKSHITSAEITEHIKNTVATGYTQISDENIKALLDIMVINVGILVPAEGEDDAFQFISDIVRYHLAAKHAKGLSDNEGEIFPLLESMTPSELASFIVPYLSNIPEGDFNFAVYSSPVLLLAGRMTKSEEELSQILKAISDILTGEYSSSIFTVTRPAPLRSNVEYLRRALLSRLMVCEDKLSEEDLSKILECNAMKANKKFFPERNLLGN